MNAIDLRSLRSVLFVPLADLINSLGLGDTLTSVILTYPTLLIPFCAWLLMGYFRSIPFELEECALIDGASRLQAFLKIVLPLSAPGMVATFLFCMMFSWNDYLFALMLTFSRSSTLPMFIAGEGTQSYGPQWWYLSALSLMAVAPMVIVALLVERYITRGLVVGAIK